MVVAILAVLTVVVTVGISMIGGSPRDQQVPDVTGKTRDDAIATLQNRGFKTTVQQENGSTVSRASHQDRSRFPSSVGAGDAITIYVSGGPEQRGPRREPI